MVSKQKFSKTLTALLSFIPVATWASCPDFSAYYAGIEDRPQEIESELTLLQEVCAGSSEYFALLGTVQLSRGNIISARENLELSLLIDPANGSALVDYGQVLFELGELFSALDINEQLLRRDDLPKDIESMALERDSRWRGLTRENLFRVSALAGYDNNLNSAPFARQLALTLSGESILFAVSPDFRPVGGEYSNIILGGQHKRAGAQRNFSLAGEARGRFGSDRRHNIVQAAMQLMVSEAGESGRWALQLDSGHLNYGGNSIFSSTTFRASYLAKKLSACNIYPRVAVQQQTFRIQPVLDGNEASLGLGADCRSSFGIEGSRLGLELVGLNNSPENGKRLGGDRDGWQFSVAWQAPVGRGLFLFQYSHTELTDELGYSPLFKDGAKRIEALDSAYLSYSLPLPGIGRGVRFIANAYFREQRNTIALFRVEGITAEIGFSFDL